MSKKVIKQVSELEPPTVKPVKPEEEAVETTLFMNGGSQAVRIPAKWKFEHNTVVITYDHNLDAVVIRNRSREEAKSALIAMIKSLSQEDRIDLEKMRVKRQNTVPEPKSDVAKFFEEAK